PPAIDFVHGHFTSQPFCHGIRGQRDMKSRKALLQPLSHSSTPSLPLTFSLTATRNWCCHFGKRFVLLNSKQMACWVVLSSPLKLGWVWINDLAAVGSRCH
ncbi:hypothetical protein ACLOJK_017448, partial [Asimina triloba]